MKLIIASGNAGKLREIRAILGDKFDEILSMKEAGIDHETVEDGKTFQENAYKKALANSSLQRIRPPRGPRRVLWVVVVTTSA